MKIAVLGAGISGLSIARLLKEQKCEVTVYEKECTIGGLARSRVTNGILYDPYGGHIFNSKHREVLEWAFSLYPKEYWKYTERNAKIFFNGKYISYPFELSLCELNTEDAVDCIYDFIMARQGEPPENYKDWLIWNFGKSICDYYMIPYNEKIWAFPLDKMETQWMEGKMPLPTKKDMIRSMLLKDPTERKMPHSTFYYPLKGGIQSFMNAMAEGIKIFCQAEVKKIENNCGSWYINGEGGYDKIISTIPLPCLGNIMDVPAEVKGSLKDLRYNSLTTVLFECPKTDITWLYVPSHDYRSHRIGYQSTLTPYAGNKQDKACAAFEIIGNKFDVKHLEKQKCILPEELGYRETLDSEYTEYAYVIYDLKYRENMARINKYFESLKGFELLGRWGRWNYNNMDKCILDSMNLVKNILK